MAKRLCGKSMKYWVLASIKDHIQAIKDGYDMCDYSFGIVYKDGSEVTVIGNDLPDERIRVSERLVAYCWESNPDDSTDSLGKSFINDFSKSDESYELWDTYIAEKVEEYTA